MGIPVLSCSLDKWSVGECVCAYMWASVCVFVIMCLFVNTHVVSCPPPVGDIRTLQWDTDPSVLQLQADSELGYIFLLSSCSLPDKKMILQYTLFGTAWHLLIV